ncbi:MAG: hypothetical protein K9N51_12435 [Candidatus Pacebacteria bacterium]|nr:hypothetical protein [Candidatus Paceibacterota bacterium]
MTGLERFQNHLRKLFQLDDTADLDFGIYRLFNHGILVLYQIACYNWPSERSE